MDARGVDFTDGRVPRTIFVLALTCLLIIAGGGSARADVTYVYDALGRLVGVIDPSSDTAVYSYDAVGNLLGIARYASSTVSIIDFQPTAGPVGTIVTIQGTGFSATPGSNAVTFNGVAATVTSSTATSIVVPVPASATTGTIGLTVSGASATSASAFTVTATGATPTITSFSPTIGVPAATVTITGTGFEPVPINNKVSFYGIPPAKSFVSTATTTSLDVKVPANARSGPLTVATPGGSAVSTADFFVPTGGYAAADVIFTGRIIVGGSSVDVPLTTTNKQALVVFDGTAGQRLDLGTVLLSGFSSPVITVYRPDGVTLATTGSTTARYLPLLPMSGIYVIALQNGGATHTLRLTLSEEVTATAVVGGSTVNVTIPRAGQRARISFSGTAGQRIDLGMTHTFLGATTYFKTADEATTLESMSLGSPGELHSPALPATATYLLVVEPGSPGTGSLTATLSEEVAGTITIGGASESVSPTRAGQRARLTFAGTVGQSISLGLTSATVSGATTLYRLDGSVHNGPTGFSVPSGGVDYAALASTGTHALLIDPTGVNTGSVTVTLSELIAGTTALNGPPVSVNITRPGQAAYWTFSGTANQRASHVISATTITGTIMVLYSGGLVGSPGALPGTTFLEPATLPVTGTYFIYVDPSGANSGSTTVTSYDVPADATGSLTINGGTAAVTLSVPGRNAILSFSGTSGQAITVRVTSNTIGCMFLVVTKPAGGGTYADSTCASSYNFGVSLTTTGTHTLKIDPQSSATGGVTVEVTIP
jgi:YD repeat-containing protein